MRTATSSFALGVVLLAGIAGSTLLAQDQTQPATGPAPAASGASAPAPHHANPRHQAKRLARKLGLTREQESQLEPILADRAQQIQSVHADSTLASQDMRARLKSIRQDSDARVEALLNDTQRQQYEQMKASHKAKKQQPANTAAS